LKKKQAIIIGAGPAGLTAAYELLKQTDIQPVIFEMSESIGGLSRTVDHKGNKIDIGGHRFFSKSHRINEWWLSFMPLQGSPSSDDIKLGREINLSQEEGAPDPETTDKVMLIRNRLSRILFERKFYQYPLSLNIKTIKNLGFLRIFKIGMSYIYSRIFPRKNEASLEDFFINRFGTELYRTFFRDYTEKIWGVKCAEISEKWGKQRIKKLSVTKILIHAAKRLFGTVTYDSQQEGETSLIERFMYPKLGPGQLWEEVAKSIESEGGIIHLNHKVESITARNNLITEIQVVNNFTGERSVVKGDHFLSTMAVRDLISAFDDNVPKEVNEVSSGLMYRDFITVGVLLKHINYKNDNGMETVNDAMLDNWIYIQESDVKVGRLQVFNNWSPYMVTDREKLWIGLEYFCDESDDLWMKPDEFFRELVSEELIKIGAIENGSAVLDTYVIKMPKAYPAYFGSYNQFNTIRDFTDKYENLFLIGRNGMHRYNNMDHSMETGMEAVSNIANGIKTKHNIWNVNIEQEYHERIKK
jgi:protoporphyrinogen oxidase